VINAFRQPALGHRSSSVATVLFGAFSFKEKAGKDKYLWLLESGNSLKAVVLRSKNIL
jgi:hypothetical protein